MQQNFDLETILSITNGINFTSDFHKVYELFWFAYNDNLINTTGAIVLRNGLTAHLFAIYPELATAIYSKKLGSMDAWIAEQKAKFGEVLPVCRIGETLEIEERHR